MAPSHHTWSMGPGGGGQFVREDVTVRATYLLTGAATGAPRTVTYWRLGRWLRVEQAGQVLWLDGPEGLFGQLGGGSLTPIEPDAVFRHPAQEADSLESADHAAAWLDVLGDPALRTLEAHPILGVVCFVSTWPKLNLRIVADADTGCVLDLSADGLRGPVTIRTTAFDLLPPDLSLFDTPTR